MEILQRLYRPFVLARYALFRRSNKNGLQKFDIADEYNVIAFFNAVSPVWLETTVVLLISEVVPIAIGTRLEIIAGLFIVNILISRIFIIRKLRKENFVERIVGEYDTCDGDAPKHSGFVSNMLRLSCYAIVPMLPVVIYYTVWR